MSEREGSAVAAGIVIVVCLAAVVAGVLLGHYIGQRVWP